MSNISSTPFLRNFVHTDFTATTTLATALAVSEVPSRRIALIVQNQSTTAIITVILNATATSGLTVAPGSSLSVENYTGIVRIKSNTASSLVHIAHSSI